jgi:monoamine oxidase
LVSERATRATSIVPTFAAALYHPGTTLEDRAMTTFARINRRRVLTATAAGLVTGSTLGVRAAPSSDSVFDVAIVGAGLSGLTAARSLAKAGLENFVVLEARDRVGGRTLNADLGDGRVSELGGQWIGRTQTAVLDLARELDVPLFATYHSGKTAYVADGKVELRATTSIVDRAFSERIDTFAAEIPLDAPWTHPRAAELDKMTYKQWLDSLELSAEQRATVTLGTQLTLAASPEQLSLLWVLFYTRSAGSYAELEGAPGVGAQELRVVGGTQRLSEEIANAIGDRLRLSSPVSAVRRWDGKGPCELETPRGIVRARRVIFALSPSQAQPIRFSPALPRERAELQRLWPATEDAMKTAMVYPTPFWRRAGLSGQSLCFDATSAHSLAWDNSPPDGKIGVIGSFVSSPYGTSLTPGARRAALIKEYVRSFGQAAAKPIAYFEHQWMTETYTKGCVSPLAPNVLSRYGAALKTSLGAIDWAGTETAAIWNGYLDGAVRAGRDSALRVLRLL